jgi:hypothetical protein
MATREESEVAVKGLRIKQWLLLVVSLISIAACAPAAYRMHPDFQARYKEVSSTWLPDPDVKVYELSAGGVRELRDDWCATAKSNVLNVIQDGMKEKSLKLTMLTPDAEAAVELEEVMQLYTAVSSSIIAHTYLWVFPEKVKAFEYSVGPIDGLLKKADADALLIFTGEDEISTGGRKALQAAGAILGITIRSGITAVSLALIDRSGEVLWYEIRGSEGGHDLRDPQSCARLIGHLVNDLPRKP